MGCSCASTWQTGSKTTTHRGLSSTTDGGRMGASDAVHVSQAALLWLCYVLLS